MVTRIESRVESRVSRAEGARYVEIREVGRFEEDG